MNFILTWIKWDTQYTSQTMINYTSAFLRVRRRPCMDQAMNYNISTTICSRIIALGIKKQLLARPYRRSRGIVNLFHKIQSIVSNRHWITTHSGTAKCNPCNLTNIAILPAETKMKTRTVCISHINTRSIAKNTHISSMYDG